DDGYAAFGVITDDDPMPAVSIADRAVTEGDHGQTADRLVVSLSEASGLPVIVTFMTFDGTATAGDDYIARLGRRTIPAGQTSTKIAVDVLGAPDPEPDETFFLQISNPIGAQLGRDTGTGTILDDDG